jgi:hypothetical protein
MYIFNLKIKKNTNIIDNIVISGIINAAIKSNTEYREKL